MTLIALSQEIRARSGLDEAVGSQYGEQGPYAMGIDYAGDALAAPEAIEVRFLRSGETPTAEEILRQLDPDLDSSNGRFPLFHVHGDAALRSWGGIPPESITYSPDDLTLAVVTADVDNDGTVEIVYLSDDDLTLSVKVQRYEGGRATVAGEGLQIEVSADAIDLTAVDRDHDGDIDLFGCWVAARAGGCVVATNDGTGMFELRDSVDHGFAPVPDASDTVLSASPTSTTTATSTCSSRTRGVSASIRTNVTARLPTSRRRPGSDRQPPTSPDRWPSPT